MTAPQHEAAATAPAVRVLLIDDEPDMLEVLQVFLETQGYDVATAESGARALERMRREGPFDVAITDLRMPGMSGVDTISALKALDPRLQVIVATGYATDETLRRCTDVGAFDHVRKPVELDDILRRIARAASARAPS